MSTAVSGDQRVEVLRSWGYGPESSIPCVTCSAEGSHDIHHLVYRSQGGTNDPSLNLAPLCRKHHDAEHAKRIEVRRVDEEHVVTTNPTTGEVLSETAWPPQHRMEEVALALSLVSRGLGDIQEIAHGLTAPELTDAMVGLEERAVEMDRARARLAFLRVIRVPKGERTMAARSLAREWSERIGRPYVESTVRNLAKQWLLSQAVPYELFDELPPSVRRVAADRVRSLDQDASTAEAERVVAQWQDRPDGQSARAFIASQRGQAANPCAECGGSGSVSCQNCGGTGVKP